MSALPATPRRTPVMHPTGALLSVAGAAIATFGSVMPWASLKSALGTFDITGTDGDGKITVVLAAIAGLCAFLEWNGTAQREMRAVTGVCALIVTAAAVYYLATLGEKADAAAVGVGVASVGAGLYMVAVGGGLALVGVGLKRNRPEPTPD